MRAKGPLPAAMLGDHQHDRLPTLRAIPLFKFATAGESDFAEVRAARDGSGAGGWARTWLVKSSNAIEFSGDFQLPLRIAVDQRNRQMALRLGDFD